MKTRKTDPKVSSENVPSGGKLPRRPGLTDETKGKAIGTRPIKPKRTVVNHAGRR